VDLLLEQIRRETQRQKDEGDLKDSEYNQILELINQLEIAFAEG
jgi:hypothetical protein